MKYCDKCKLQVEGVQTHCPLCQNQLRDLGSENVPVFPAVPTLFRQNSLFFQLLIFGSIVAVVISVTVNLLIPHSGYWSLFVAAGILCFWVSFAIALHKRSNISKNILYQVVIISILAILWDLGTGWHGWSLDYVFPIVCVAAMIAMAAIARVMHLPIVDQMIYFVLDAFFGILPVIFVWTGLVGVPYPSIICAAGSVISLAALLIFEGHNMLTELKRRLHL
ncbi:DUF6320 domain-containing protein [Zongyangia hominis]|uniref:Zinc ribbon domain-containing protein n=1 Tax=Zongyangia hominis TaxID=2763677 RepID=A0A926EEU4_9FIRM|nr:DUF6320 domain-containing protein [Zongyangia hominis]MBC8571159.1 hypothetical protein [Zongyangia hominis]